MSFKLLKVTAQLLLLLSLLSSVVKGQCNGKQSYVISLNMTFTRNSVPQLRGKDPKVPRVVAISHVDNFILFEEKVPLDDAAAEIARAGTAHSLESFLDNHTAMGSISSYYIGKDIEPDGVTKFELKVKDDSNLITIMAQLSPSPAWFVGTSKFQTCNRTNNEFIVKQDPEVLPLYDSGLTRGTSFDSQDNQNLELPVKPVDDFGDAEFGNFSLEQGSLSVNWWWILIGVLLGILLILLIIFVVYPRIRRARKREQVPLMTNDEGVEW